MSSTMRLNFAQMCARLANDEIAAVQFMQGRGLIHGRRICPRCGRYMVLRSREDRDDVRWRCARKECRKELSAKTRTWFQGCEQPIKTMLLFIRAWAEKWTTLAFCRGAFDMNEAAGLRLNAAMRHVAEEWLLKNPVPVGGSSLTVEVNETLFSKRKYNRGRVLP
uniref:Transposase zinc-ribbon domain-containing protein n=1 Tax=Trichuris muris TaxID=70415 RepID=A0A5S6QJI5_TRIMR